MPPSGCPRNKLTLCLITDRRRLVDQLGIDLEGWAEALVAQIRGAVAGGVSIVQVRERGLEDRAYGKLLDACLALTRGTPTRLVVNDRLDLALAAGADGVHLREDSVPLDAIRAVVPGEFLVGRSVHDAEAAARARAADYMIAGSVFETASKPGQPATLGLDGLRQVVDAARPRPVWALGGLSLERVPAVVGCGVAGVASIGAFLPERGTADVAAAVEKLTKELRFSLARAVELT